MSGIDQQAAPPTRRTATAASLPRRFVAWLVDGAFVLTPVVLANSVGSATGARSIPTALAIGAAFGFAVYNLMYLVTRTGQSLGRWALSIKLLDSGTMQPPRPWQIILRGIIGGPGFGFATHPFSYLGIAIGIGPWPLACYAFAVADRRWHRGLNDRWAHTVVIDTRPERAND